MFASVNYVEAHGPFSKHARRSSNLGADGVADGLREKSNEESEAAV